VGPLATGQETPGTRREDLITGCKLRVERATVPQQVDGVKTIHSGKLMSIYPEMLELLKTWRINIQFSSDEDCTFGSAVRIGRLPVSYPRVWQMFQRAAGKPGLENWARIHFFYSLQFRRKSYHRCQC
jgi:hypothetical protein